MDSTLRLRTRPWIWPALLSLDAPVIAVLWLLLFSHALRVRVPESETALLAMAVWLIYVADRVMDSFREIEREPLALRHRFYRECRAAFVAPFCVILLLAAWIAWTRLDAHTLRAGVALAAVVAAYLGVVHLSGSSVQRWFPKELAVALLFCAGTCLPIFTRVDAQSLPELASFLVFALAAWMNTALIEYVEWITLRDGSEERPSALTIGVARGALSIGLALCGFAIAAMALSAFQNLRPVLAAESVSALGLAVIGGNWRRVSSHVLRISADAVLCTPAVVLALASIIRR